MLEGKRMKQWLLCTALLVIADVTQAKNYLIVQSPSQKIDVWIDNVKGNTAQHWCTSKVKLRIVVNGDQNVKVLDNFLPRVGMLMARQCSRLQQLNWKLVNSNNKYIAKGNSLKSQKWAPVRLLEDRFSVADRTPWQEFTLLRGCRLRTFWQNNDSALFIPVVESDNCKKGRWLSGRTIVTQLINGEEKQKIVTFVHGFPIVGLNIAAIPNKLLIMAVNNQRMVVSHEGARRSWMILPYVAEQNCWQITGTLAIEITREQASDPVRLQTRLETERNVWAPWLASDIKLNVVLIEHLNLLLRNPIASAWRVIN